MKIYIDFEPEEHLEDGETESNEERKVKRGTRNKKYMIRIGRRAGLLSKTNANHMLLITRIGKRSS